jgi:ATP-GRASP peptide maturase of grasp-with-spasm system
MILIIKRNELDISTELVISWLHAKKSKFQIINLNDSNEYFNIFGDSKINLDLKKNEKCIIWNWRSNTSQHIDLEKNQFNSFFQMESKILLDYIFDNINSDSVWYPSKTDLSLNKLSVLKKCKELEIKTPDTIVTNNKKDVLLFLDKNKKIITKPIFEVDAWESTNLTFTLYTEFVNSEIINSLPDTFFPSLFQECIEKVFEIRSFYIDGDIFSMAIFSQENKKTEIDFRHYDKSNENRISLFKLPNEIELKLTVLMEKLKLNSGSIDLIYTKNNEYVFLEINPVGQYNMVSEPCNYYLEKIIANKLTL